MSKRTAKKRTLVLGTGPLAQELLGEIARHPRCEYDIVGVVVEPGISQADNPAQTIVGTVEELDRILLEYKPQVIIVALSQGSMELYEQHLLEASFIRSTRIEQAATVYEELSGKLPLASYELDDVVYSDTFRPKRSSQIATRLLSLAAAILGLILTAPLMLIIAVLIKLDSPGPVLFMQERAGYRGKQFKLAKFRTMRPAEGPCSEWEGDNADRITRVGRWLRKFRLDELPQFFNVLAGHMNLVGPRPHPVSNIAMLALVARNTPESGVSIPYYDLRSSVRPGITGWAQVRYQYANNLQEEIEKLHFDLYYIKHYSLRLDLKIILETIWVVGGGHVVKAEKAQEDTDTGRAASPVASDRQSPVSTAVSE